MQFGDIGCVLGLFSVRSVLFGAEQQVHRVHVVNLQLHLVSTRLCEPPTLGSRPGLPRMIATGHEGLVMVSTHEQLPTKMHFRLRHQ